MLKLFSFEKLTEMINVYLKTGLRKKTQLFLPTEITVHTGTYLNWGQKTLEEVFPDKLWFKQIFE